MRKLTFCVRLFRGFHSGSPSCAKIPRVPVEYVANRTPSKSPRVLEFDDLEESAIEISQAEVFEEIQHLNIRSDEKLVANADMPPYEKLRDSDTSLSALMTRTKGGKRSEVSRLLVLEGRRLIEDAFNAGLKAHSVFFSQKELVQGIQLPAHSITRFFKIPYKNLKLWSTFSTCPGITGFFWKPKEAELQSLVPRETDQDSLAVNLVCDNIRDPGNLGAIVRSAAGAGCNQIILTKGCVDVWNSKVLRGSMGSVFRLPVVQKENWSRLEELSTSEKAAVFVADSSSHAEDTKNFSEVDFKVGGRPIVLVVGGETRGLSREALRLLEGAKFGGKIHIPLACGVESLNVTAAVSVLLFEIRRQRMMQIEHAQQQSCAS